MNIKEKILDIKEVEDRTEFGRKYDGFEVKTTEQVIFVGISNYQDCCEDWGYVSTIDDVKDYIDAELLNIVIVDENLNTKDFVESDESAAMFVNFETSKGTFQLTMYNIHNGYYSHDAVLVSRQLDREVVL